MGCISNTLSFLKSNLLTCLIICGVITGIIVGVVLKTVRSTPYTTRETMYVGFPGEIFLQILKAIAVPLMIACLISALSTVDSEISKRIGCHLAVYILATKCLSVFLALSLGLVAQPGSRIEVEFSSGMVIKQEITIVDVFLDLIRNLFPANILQMIIRQYQTVLIQPKNDSTLDMEDWGIKRSGSFIDVINVVGIVIVSIAIGIALGVIGPKGESMVSVFNCLSKATMLITHWMLWLAPFCIIFLIAKQIILMKDYADVMMKLGVFTSVYIALLLIQGVLLYPLIFFLFARMNPYSYMANFSEAMATAFATSSSTGTLPVSISCMIDNNKIDAGLVNFVMPLGAAINKDGTVIFHTLAIIFIGNLNHRNYSFGDLFVIFVMCILASLAAAGVPSAAILSLIIVLDALRLPLQDISLLLALDWIFDRLRTVINVLGDAIGAGILAKLHANSLAEGA